MRRVHSSGGGQRWLSTLVFLLLIACGVILMLSSEHLTDPHAKRFAEELGIVLVAVFTVSLIYEHLIADMHFRRMYEHLEELIRGAENNAARCESLGIREIHETRQSYEQLHSFPRFIETCGPGTTIRIVGRSLIYTMQVWEEQLTKLVQRGVRLELCFYDPEITDSPLEVLSGYNPKETEIALDIFKETARPWLEAETRPGGLEIRFHRVHLMDSYFEVRGQKQHWGAWDFNFGRGTSQRRIFVIEGESVLGENLSKGRYDLIWEGAERVYMYPPAP